MTDPDYIKIMALSSVSMAIYVALVPVSMLLMLKSSWGETMYRLDHTAFVRLFGFFTSRYRRDCRYWEIVLFARRLLLVLVILYNGSSVSDTYAPCM